jgi:hypothetical protein
MRKALIVIGVAIVCAGLLWPWLSKLPIGRFPGDIIVRRPGFTLYIPITTMIVVSVVVSLILWILRK